MSRYNLALRVLRIYRIIAAAGNSGVDSFLIQARLAEDGFNVCLRTVQRDANALCSEHDFAVERVMGEFGNGFIYYVDRTRPLRRGVATMLSEVRDAA